jgi:hypothetical protein
MISSYSPTPQICIIICLDHPRGVSVKSTPEVMMNDIFMWLHTHPNISVQQGLKHPNTISTSILNYQDRMLIYTATGFSVSC